MKERLADQTIPLGAEVIATAQASADPEVTQPVTITEQPAPEKVYPEPKAKVIFGETDGKATLVPIEPERQTEWVHGPHNKFDLDRKQLGALDSEARKAYLTAMSERMRPDGSMTPSASELSSRLSERRQEETADATIRAEAARAKADEARDALNGGTTDSTKRGAQASRPDVQAPASRTESPEPKQHLLADRLEPTQLDKLDKLAQDAALHESKEGLFQEAADQLGVTLEERKALLDLAEKTTTARREALHPVPVTNLDPNDPQNPQMRGRNVEPVGSAAGENTTQQIPHPSKESAGAPSAPEAASVAQPGSAPEQAVAELVNELYEQFEAGSLSQPGKRVLAAGLAQRAQTAYKNGEPEIGEMLSKVSAVYQTLDDQGKDEFNATFGPIPTSKPSENRPKTYKEVMQDLPFEYRRDEALKNIEAAQKARAAGDEDLVGECMDRVRDVQATFSADEIDKWNEFTMYRGEQQPDPNAVPDDANGDTESEADRKKRIHDVFLEGKEDTLTPTEKADLILDMQEDGDDMGAYELFDGLTTEERTELKNRRAARNPAPQQAGNQPPKPEDQPAPVPYDVDGFTLTTEADRYDALNQIADYAHKLMDAKADSAEIEKVWEDFDELYNTLPRKEKREFRNKASKWEFNDVTPLERFSKNPIKTIKESHENRKIRGSEKRGAMQAVEKQRLEKGIDANGDWIGMPIRNRAEDEATTEARYLDAGNLRREADSLNRWAHPIKKSKLNAAAREQERAYRVESMAPVELTNRQRKRIGLTQVHKEAGQALNNPNNAQWLFSTATKEDLAQRANALYQSENEFDPNQFTGPQYAGAARTLVPGSWRRNRRYIGQGRVTDLQQRLTSARREADYNYAVTAWNYRQQQMQQAQAQAGPQNYGGQRRP